MSAPFSPSFPAALVLTVLLAGCGNGGGQEAEVPQAPPVEDNAQVMRVGGRNFSIPSPIQSALAMRKAGLSFQRSALLPLEQADALSGRSEQALALGMYGADLAHATIHQDGQRTLATLQAIEKVSSRLDLGNAFDKALLERFKGNLSNEDSLLRFSGAAFRAADEYLKTNERDDVSALVLAGGWLEALHLTLVDPKAASAQSILDRVGEQRTTLDGLVELLGAHASDARTATLHKSLSELQVEFRGLEMVYQYEPPVTDREARVTYINSITKVNVAPEKLAAIAAKVASIRSSILA